MHPVSFASPHEIIFCELRSDLNHSIIRYQQTLHRNLTFLASLADPSLNLQTIIPVSSVVCLV
jgi:hypothetical protein